MLIDKASFADPPLEDFEFSDFSKHRIRLRVLRLDKMDTDIGGNKLFKLKYNIENILKLGSPAVVSFGGAYSNHLRALAAAGEIHSFKTHGFVRGEIVRPLNPILKFCDERGMELHAISREDYRSKSSEDFITRLRSQFGNCYILPEGGSNIEALLGSSEIPQFIAQKSQLKLRYIILACGTGLTLSGIVLGGGRLERTKVIGFSVLKAPGYLFREVTNYLALSKINSLDERLISWQIEDDYHCGGYAKTNTKLLEFVDKFTRETSLPIEPVYTGKMLYGFSQLVDRGLVQSDTEVIAIHTGGVHH